jgi:hypothetical protein
VNHTRFEDLANQIQFVSGLSLVNKARANSIVMLENRVQQPKTPQHRLTLILRIKKMAIAPLAKFDSAKESVKSFFYLQSDFYLR